MAGPAAWAVWAEPDTLAALGNTLRFTGGALALSHGNGRVYDAGAGMATHHMGAVHLFAVTGRPVGKRRIGSRNTFAGGINAGFSGAAGLLGITCAEVTGQTAPAKVGAGDFIKNHVFGAFLHFGGKALARGRGGVGGQSQRRVFSHGAGILNLF